MQSRLKGPTSDIPFDIEARQKLISKNISPMKLTTPEMAWACSDGKSGDIVRRASINDFKFYLSNDLLTKVDRMSMAHSVEIRAPFLDKRLIEFAFGELATEEKLQFNKRKRLLVEIGKVLPNDYEFSRKQGFSIPIDNWLRKGKYREYFWDILTQKFYF